MTLLDPQQKMLPNTGDNSSNALYLRGQAVGFFVTGGFCFLTSITPHDLRNRTWCQEGEGIRVDCFTVQPAPWGLWGPRTAARRGPLKQSIIPKTALGWGSLRLPSLFSPAKEFFIVVKIYVRCTDLYSYLSCVTAAELRRHLSNMNVIVRRWTMFWWFW